MGSKTMSLTVEISPELVSVLDELAANSGNSLTDELKLAIGERKYLSDKSREGYSVVLRNDAVPDELTVLDLRFG